MSFDAVVIALPLGVLQTPPPAEVSVAAAEAMDSEMRSGTVHGAIGSGRRAARGVLRRLG